MPRKTGSRTGARSAASSAETRTWLFRWFQRAWGPDARQTLVRSAPSSRKRGAAGGRATTARVKRMWAKGQTTALQTGKRRDWREATTDRAQKKGGRPLAA